MGQASCVLYTRTDWGLQALTGSWMAVAYVIGCWVLTLEAWFPLGIPVGKSFPVLLTNHTKHDI